MYSIFFLSAITQIFYQCEEYNEHACQILAYYEGKHWIERWSLLVYGERKIVIFPIFSISRKILASRLDSKYCTHM